MKQLVIFLLLFVYFLGSAFALECEEVQDDELPSLYVKIVCSGNELIKEGAYDEALKRFEKGVKLNLEDRANYELYENLIEASCKAGAYKKAWYYIKEYSCMLRIDSGKLPCKKEYGFKYARNEEVSDLCYETMCQEDFLEDYKSPSKVELESIKQKHTKLKELKAICQ